MKLRMLVVAGTLLTATALPPAVAAGGFPAAWAWVTARQPMSAMYTPAARDRGNSAGGVNFVERTGVGVYEVTFPDLFNGDDSHVGIVHVTAMDANPRFCTVGGWGRLGGPGGDADLRVHCFSFDGAAADTRFSAIFIVGGEGSGQIAYLHADRPSTTSYTPDPWFQFNSGGNPNTMHRSDKGKYRADLPDMPDDEGNIQVTALLEKTCRVLGWSPGLDAIPINVRCHSPAGSLVNAPFNLLYTHDVGMTGVPRPYAAYAFADMQSDPMYAPPAAYSYSSGGSITVNRTGVGTYVVTLGGMARGGAALVTAVGTGKSRCQLGGIRTSATPQKIGVRCFTPVGDSVDSKFMLSYSK